MLSGFLLWFFDEGRLELKCDSCRLFENFRVQNTVLQSRFPSIILIICSEWSESICVPLLRYASRIVISESASNSIGWDLSLECFSLHLVSVHFCPPSNLLLVDGTIVLQQIAKHTMTLPNLYLLQHAKIYMRHLYLRLSQKLLADITLQSKEMRIKNLSGG